MKKKLIYIICILALFVIVIYSFGKSKKEIFLTIKQGDSQVSVIQKLGKDYIDGTSFFKLYGENESIEIYCWQEEIIEFLTDEDFPYLSKQVLSKSYIIYFKDKKVFDLVESESVIAMNSLYE